MMFNRPTEEMDKVVIRPASGRDAEAIARLSGDLGYEVSAEMMARRLEAIAASGSDLVVVAVRELSLRKKEGKSERQSEGENEGQSSRQSLRQSLGQDGEVIGWLQAHAAHILESGFRVEITGMVVAPEARRSGVGRLLVAEAERWAREKGAEVVVVRSNAKRVESHLFYPVLGFRESKTQKVYRKDFRILNFEF